MRSPPSRATAAVEPQAGDELVFDCDMKFFASDQHECANNSTDHFSFRHGPMMLGVKSAMGSMEDEPVEIDIARDAECKAIGAGRYETTATSGENVVLQPLWGKENLTEPQDVYQVLFSH